ncbi:WAT1-related protein At3g02690, chloroplastic isoform X2 [Brachypodium distachyon]|uniref:WAT1-related protein At3g02690, chloroplastic isoform X2 n=1 Tax=Brachypodium distachyon TaxID=15368 RepID=UPI000D0CDB2E|nr:WAT1-related protein At3g02690, chloroplastic isoform X2 [Brachypodium distachyon]|eukprot:XP_024316998.1 WAT1-related protein At3g02690, chloroplastic isoform X2 [Brachypodium distachyon]
MCTAGASLLLLPLHPPLPTASALHSLPRRGARLQLRLAAGRRETPPPVPSDELECVGTGTEVECFVEDDDDSSVAAEDGYVAPSLALGGREWWEWASLVSPFFFWGTAMVAMKGVIPKTGPFFVAALRLIPAGALVVAFAAARGRKQPSGWAAWGAIAAFGLVDAACFQGFLTEGLQKTSAGLGSVIIDSQPLTVAVLAALFFGESIGAIGVGGLVLGVVGLLLLEVPALSVQGNDTTVWGSGEWWMFLSAQSMAIGTIMVRWVSKYSDPIMATGWRYLSVFLLLWSLMHKANAYKLQHQMDLEPRLLEGSCKPSL